MKAVLALKDGTILTGPGFGAKTEKVGELVFNTSMTGYQEALTDPSYAGQILIMTYPLIGNYGINKNDQESDRVHVSGYALRHLSPDYDHRSAFESLDVFLKEFKTPGIHGIDTRFLVRKIRNGGVTPAILATFDDDQKVDPKALLKKLEFDYSSVDFVSQVTTKTKQVYNKGGKKRVVLFDYGMKLGIVRQLVANGAEVHVLPSFCTAAEVKACEPDGIMLSNGPGDPAILKDAHKTIRDLAGYKPIFGICLGNQLLAHAFGGDTYKLKFGHRGSNHAVHDLTERKVVITTQNHGFAVGKIPDGFELTHINVNDKTTEGMHNPNKQIFSVQYHPEASPGPHDSRYLFEKFFKMI